MVCPFDSCETSKQATSYCETALGLLAWSADTPLPAYTPPATPSTSLNADPGALGAFPGPFGAVSDPHVWFGWPLVSAV